MPKTPKRVESASNTEYGVGYLLMAWRTMRAVEGHESSLLDTLLVEQNNNNPRHCVQRNGIGNNEQDKEQQARPE